MLKWLADFDWEAKQKQMGLFQNRWSSSHCHYIIVYYLCPICPINWSVLCMFLCFPAEWWSVAFSDCRLPFFVSGPAKWMESMAIPEATALDNSKHAAKLGSVSIPHKHTHKHTHTHTYNLYYIIRTYIYIYNMCNYVYNYVYSYIIKLYNYIYIYIILYHTPWRSIHE